MFTNSNKYAVARVVLILAFVLGMLGLQPIKHVLAAASWYVTTAGNDASDCATPSTPCATINGAIAKAVSGDTIKIAIGTYTTSANTAVLRVNKSIAFEGGWDTAFVTQTGFSTINGETVRVGVSTAPSDFGFPVTVSIDRFIIENGYGANSGGISNYATLTVNRSFIRHNQIGGIHNQGNLTLNNSSVYENQGIALYSSSRTGNVEITNTTISHNTGTGIYVWSSGTVQINNSTITNNASVVGGGIYKDTGSAQIYLKNSIIANNTATGYFPPLPGNLQDCNTTLNSGGNNIISTTAGTGGCFLLGGSNDTMGIDPQLSEFLPMKGYQPLGTGSPAINTGNPATCLVTDQRGIARDSQCDIGAYEYTVPGPLTEMLLLSGDNQYAETGRAFQAPLKIVLLDSVGSPKPNIDVTFSAPVSGASGTFAGNQNNTTTILSNNAGVAVAPTFTANNTRGTYIVNATTASLGTVIAFHLENLAWFVAPDGNDTNTCTTPEAPCATINSAINKATAGATVYIKAGTYNSGVTPVKDIILSGGWDANYLSQSGLTTIDGQNANTGISISNLSVTIDHFEIANARPGIDIYRGLSSAVNNPPPVNVIISNSLIRNNAAKGSVGGTTGGGINITGGNLTIDRSTIRNNTADKGAGIYSYGGTILITNSTLSGNTANLYGGGINFDSGISYNTNTLHILYSTIAHNVANNSGGGIYQFQFNTRPIYIENSIVAKNSATFQGPDCYSLIDSSYYNIFSSLNPSECSVISSFWSQVTDPKIDPGLTGVIGYHALLPGSPAIDAGNDVPCPAFDQRGLSRPQGGHCDIGAYEVDQPPFIESITRANPNPTILSSANFTVTFNEPVTGVGLSDFTLATTGVSGAAITGVSGTGATYTVTVNTGSGNGTIRLDAVDDDSIKDGSNNLLGGVGSGNGSFTGGETYMTNKGFNAIDPWTSAFDLSHGWTVQDFVRTVGDVNGDGKADLVGFGLDGVYVGLSDGTSFAPTASKWTSAFDLSHGWTVQDFVRTVGDVNGDGKADLVGFGLDGVYVGLSDGASFAPTASKWTSAFDLLHGWTVKDFVRTVGDVNGDGKADLIGFGLDGVYVGLSDGTSFAPTASKWTSAFDLLHGWTVKDFVRTVGDMNGDGKADLVGFGLDGVYVALSNGASFAPVSKWASAFDLSHGWTVKDYLRTVGDVNLDGRADLVGFGQDGVYVALSTGSDFTTVSKWTSAFDLSHGWTVKDYVRTVMDVNGDGKADLVGFGLNGVYVTTSK